MSQLDGDRLLFDISHSSIIQSNLSAFPSWFALPEWSDPLASVYHVGFDIFAKPSRPCRYLSSRGAFGKTLLLPPATRLITFRTRTRFQTTTTANELREESSTFCDDRPLEGTSVEEGEDMVAGDQDGSRVRRSFATQILPRYHGQEAMVNATCLKT